MKDKKRIPMRYFLQLAYVKRPVVYNKFLEKYRARPDPNEHLTLTVNDEMKPLLLDIATYMREHNLHSKMKINYQIKK